MKVGRGIIWVGFPSLVGLWILAACTPASPAAPTPDISAIKTSVAQTVVAEFTLTAEVISPTAQPATSSPTLSVSATLTTSGSVTPIGTLLGCTDDANYDLANLDVNTPDNTEMTPSQTFIKTWRIKNTGTCPWRTGYSVVYGYGDSKMSGVAQPLITEVQAGQEVEVSVDFKSPASPGTYQSFWRMSSPNGGPFGKFFSVKIIVR
jgi:hypothetical protein